MASAAPGTELGKAANQLTRVPSICDGSRNRVASSAAKRLSMTLVTAVYFTISFVAAGELGVLLLAPEGLPRPSPTSYLALDVWLGQ